MGPKNIESNLVPAMTNRVHLHALAALALTSFTAHAGPTVIPTAEGQIGESPFPNDQVFGPTFESFSGDGLPLIGGTIPVRGLSAGADVALLDPAGNRLVIPSFTFDSTGGINGNIVDVSGLTPQVTATARIDTTTGDRIFNRLPSVAANRDTGEFTVVWEQFDDLSGNFGDIRGRRFDPMSNPVEMTSS